MNPLVTVIIPSYNHELYIRESIQSVLDQTYSNWELLVIDDVSPDSTFEIVCSMLEDDPRAVLMRKTHNTGAIDSYNIGIKRAKGEYIAFLASDDVWEPDFLQYSVMAAVGHPNSIVFSNANGLTPYFHSEGLYSPRQMRKVFCRCNPIVAISCLYPASFMKSLLDIDPELYLEDYFIRWESVFAGLDHYYTNRSLVQYRQPEGSMSSQVKKMAIARYNLLNIVWPRLSLRERLLFSFSLLARTLKSFYL